MNWVSSFLFTDIIPPPFYVNGGAGLARPAALRLDVLLIGAVVPVVDIGVKFGMAERHYAAFTVIIIVEVKGRLVGMIVDTVSDVANIPIEAIQDTPHFTAKIETDFIKGIGQLDSRLVIILDVARIMTADEMRSMDIKSSREQ
mgnify:CR=1 FL=1